MKVQNLVRRWYANLSRMLVINTSPTPAKILVNSERRVVCNLSRWIKEECTKMSIGIKVEDCDDHLCSQGSLWHVTNVTLPIRWAALNIIVRLNSQICLGKRHWVHILWSMSLDVNSDFPLPEIQAQLTLFESNYERYMLCDGRPGCFTLLIAKELVLHICVSPSSAWLWVVRRVSPTSYPLSLPFSSSMFNAIIAEAFRILISWSYKLIVHWIVAWNPSNPWLIVLPWGSSCWTGYNWYLRTPKNSQLIASWLMDPILRVPTNIPSPVVHSDFTLRSLIKL